ncbi:MAG: hypothetical protein IKT38_01055 [Clostridia bacterium]|nr:hypothetical protein [Clostridia bacterium]
MDDLSEKLASILNNEESMNRVRQMAESILGEQKKPETQSSLGDFSSLLGDIDIASLMNIVSKFNSASSDPRAQLLTALKPHLSAPKQEKVDTAIKILRVIEILPILKESGILNF